MSEKYQGTKFETVYCGEFKPTKKEIFLIDKLIEVGKELAQLGCQDKNGGNFSVRTKEAMIIKTTGSWPDRLTREDFVLVSGFKKNQVFVKGNQEPSSEARLHWGTYEVRPDINCLLHSHDFLVINSSTRLRDIGYIKNYPYGTMELARAVKRSAKKWDYIIMKDHGVLSLGKDIKTAFKLIKKYHEKFKTITEETTTKCRAKKE